MSKKGKAISNQKLCELLLVAENESEVIAALSEAGYWEDESSWCLLGGLENNYSIVGNQKEYPVDALVEKIVNSVDAVLMRECLLSGTNPESNDAPKSISDALEKYFGIKSGNLANLTATERTKLASNIGLVATGQKSNPSYTIFDRGEGQTPTKIPLTFLSLAKSNKLRIPFVQGQFNQGGTAVLRFCGKQSLQLLISRRHPGIVKSKESTDEHWGFTLVRREDPSDKRKSSTFTYLAPEGKLLSFKADELTICGSTSDQKIDPLQSGTIIKLYEYEMPGGLKTIINFDLYNQISLLLPGIGLPVRFYEQRNYEGHSPESTLAGLKVRLEDDKRDNVEDNFPSYQEFNAGNEKFGVWIYAFRQGGAEKYRKNEGILFSFHGQTQGTISSSFFTRSNVGLGYLADSILLIVDCDKISQRVTETLFMNSRDRLSRGQLRSEIESELEGILKAHQGLKELKQKRRREAVDSKIGDSKPLQEMIDEALKKSPALQNLFRHGFDIKNPFKPKSAGEGDKFEPQQYPSYFQIIEKDISRSCHLNLRFRVQFETDVVNDYLGRERSPGKASLTLNGKKVSEKAFVLNIWNGIATLTVSLPKNTQIGDVLKGELSVVDETLLNPFKNAFERIVEGTVTIKPGKPGKRRQPPTNGKGPRNLPDSFALPFVKEVYEPEWSEHKFDKFSGAKVVDNGDEGFDFFVNMDNIFLLTELKRQKETDAINLIKAQFKYGLVLIALSLISHKKTSENGETETPFQNVSLEEYVRETTKGISPVLLPIIEVLGELQLEEVFQDGVLVVESEN